MIAITTRSSISVKPRAARQAAGHETPLRRESPRRSRLLGAGGKGMSHDGDVPRRLRESGASVVGAELATVDQGPEYIRQPRRLAVAWPAGLDVHDERGELQVRSAHGQSAARKRLSIFSVVLRNGAWAMAASAGDVATEVKVVVRGPFISDRA